MLLAYKNQVVHLHYWHHAYSRCYSLNWFTSPSYLYNKSEYTYKTLEAGSGLLDSKTGTAMKHIAAYLLLQTGGNASPSASDVKGLLDTVGIEADQAQLDKLISELEGKDINELIAEGSSKLASVPSGGGGGAAPAAAAAGGAAPAEAAKEEKKEEAKEESDDDMGFGLFD